MRDIGADWEALAIEDRQCPRAAFSYAYDEARAGALAREDSALLDNYYRGRGTNSAGLSQILEFGTELTRGSDWLSQKGALAIADLVPSEIHASYVRLKAKPLTNISFVVLRDIRDISLLPSCDLLYSILSVQQIPAVMLAKILPILLSKVDAGGAALIRVPTQHRHYHFMLDGTEEMDALNVIPQWKLFDILDSSGFSLVIVQEEPLLRASDIIYHLILAQRRI
jgi:hypothetical protein